MATVLQEVIDSLQHADPRKIHITHLSDGGMYIKIPPPLEPQKKGKWAKVAKEMAQEGYLQGEGAEILKSAKTDFRESFVLKEVSFDKRK